MGKYLSKVANNNHYTYPHHNNNHHYYYGWFRSHRHHRHHRERRLLMAGLDGSGKTTLITRLVLDGHIRADMVIAGTPAVSRSGGGSGSRSASATRGCNVWRVDYSGRPYSLWDVGGTGGERTLWRNYFGGTDGLAFVIDSGDRRRLPEASVELHKILNDREMRDVVLVVVANKHDLPNTMSAKELEFKLGLNRIRQKHWYIVTTSALYGTGIGDCMKCFQPPMITTTKTTSVVSSDKLPVQQPDVYKLVDNY
ncbi:uncharacterized protein LOC128953386 [Oppia nitens]|uniref:uncharacterized protein LOC128953386 n=1 Tax=Oppia nitens TaxID=1686743 RepID=UPI0023DB758E|nr:uncharacterized protein LOC128953386 [Oppia nitens]